MKSEFKTIVTAVLAIVAFIFNWACKKDVNVLSKDVQITANAQFGAVLTDKNGKTLYFFSEDANGNSLCYGNCALNWFAFYKENPTLADGLNPADFGTITRQDGAKQTTYKGWPLYYFKNDAKEGDVNGDNFNNVWFVAKPDYSIMLANNKLIRIDGIQYTSQYQPGQEIVQYFTDDYGRTLYAFAEKDSAQKNKFTKPDFSNNGIWPIYTSQLKSIPSSLNRSLFDSTNVYGKMQLTFKGWPLYYFGQDNQQRGNTKGVSFPKPGGIWKVVNQNAPYAPK